MAVDVSPLVVGWVMIGVVVALLLAGLPVAFAMFVAGAIGHLVVVGVDQTVASIPIIFYDKMSNYTLGVIPLFIIMGFFSARAGFADEAFVTGRKWVGHVPGGLVQATIVAGTAFAAACGTTIAACAALARICIPPMRQSGVNEKLAIGIVAAVGPLSLMIPPSIFMPVYAIITDQSVGKLLIAGIIPGLLAAVMMMLFVFLWCKIKPDMAPATPRVPWRERLVSLRGLWGIALVFLVTMGSIYTGIVTPTEAAAVGALAALAVGLATRRLHWHDGIVPSLLETARSTCTILIIMVCALYFSHFLAISRVPHTVTTYLVSLNVAPIMIIIGSLVLNLLLGCIMDTLSILLLTMPIIFPAIVGLGFSPIWYGVLMCMGSEMGAITPPFGLNLFILRDALPDVSMSTILRGVTPFVGLYVFMWGVYVAFPQLSLWLPGLMK